MIDILINRDDLDDFSLTFQSLQMRKRLLLSARLRFAMEKSVFNGYLDLAHWRRSHRYHGTEEVKEGGRFNTSLELDQKLYHLARLRIDNVAKADAGEYRAVAKNKHGQGVATINLNFEGGDKLK